MDLYVAMVEAALAITIAFGCLCVLAIAAIVDSRQAKEFPVLSVENTWER